MCTGKTYLDTRPVEEWSERIYLIEKGSPSETKFPVAANKVDFVSEEDVIDEANEQDRMEWSEKAFKEKADEFKQIANEKAHEIADKKSDLYSEHQEHQTVGMQLARYKLETYMGTHPDANLQNLEWISRIDLGGRLTPYIQKELESRKQKGHESVGGK